MKKATKELLLTVIKDYTDYSKECLDEAISCEDYYTARDKAEDIMHYSNCLTQFEDVEDIESMTNEEFSNYFSEFESYQLVREWLKEPEDWEDDILNIAKENYLTEGVDEVIALLK